MKDVESDARFDSPQVKQDLISSITNFVHQLHHEFSNDLRLKTRKYEEILKLVGGRAQCPVSLPEIRLWP